jgi:3-oxoacyl-[acyl-carrier protein] reductase
MISTTKTAIVTGASRGIGAAIANHLAAVGYAVVINYHTHGEEAEHVRSEIAAQGGNALTFRADLSAEAEAKALVDFAVESFGRLDVLVNNAGIAVGGPLAEIDAAHIHTLTAINIAGLLFASKHAAFAFGEAGGAIVNISSINGISPIPGATVYSATKAAVNAITVGLAQELGSKRIRVNAVAPGLTMTERYAVEVPEEAKQYIIGKTPLGRLGVPGDLVGLVGFLASDAAGWITGQVITASGGAT